MIGWIAALARNALQDKAPSNLMSLSKKHYPEKEPSVNYNTHTHTHTHTFALYEANFSANPTFNRSLQSFFPLDNCFEWACEFAVHDFFSSSQNQALSLQGSQNIQNMISYKSAP